MTFALAEEVRFVNRTGYYYRLDNPKSSIHAGDKAGCLKNEISWLEEQLKQRGIYQEFSERFHRVKAIQTVWMKRKTENIRETEIYRRIQKSTQCILFGCGADGVDLLLLLSQEGIHTYISCITDNDSRLWGKKMLGIPVISPVDTMQIKDALYIITSSRYAVEIERQLNAMGIMKNNIQVWGIGGEK